MLVFFPWNKSKKGEISSPIPTSTKWHNCLPCFTFPSVPANGHWRQGIGLWGLVVLDQFNCYDPDRCYLSTLIKFYFIVKIFLRKVSRISEGLTVLTLFLLSIWYSPYFSEKDVCSNFHIPIFHISSKFTFIYQDSRGRLNWKALPWAGIKLYMGMPF